MRDRLAFLHLPKSAGTSYRYAIARYFQPAETVPWSFDRWMFGNHPGVDDIPQPILLDQGADLSGYRYMEGHFAVPTIEQGFDVADIVCILREPRARLLSHYTFWRSWGPELRDQWLPYDVPRTARQSLRDFCNDPASAHQSDNLIARLILGPHPSIPTDAMIADEDLDTLTEQATDRIDTLGFVDVLERGAESFDALEAWFGSPLERVRLNETDLDEGPPRDVAELTDPDALDALDRRTVIDRALWRHVAVRNGMPRDAVARLADDTFDTSLARLVARTHERTASPDPATDAIEVDGHRLGGPRRRLAAIRQRLARR